MQSSDQNVKWYIDLYGCVHIETEKFYLKGETYLPNFKVNTHDKGEYPLEITFNVRSTEYKDVKKEIGKHIVKRLTLKVE